MKTIITKLLMLTAVLSASTNIYAYDFKVDGIYYNIISSSENTVEVTYRNDDYISYSGNVVIPEQVSYNNDTYRVISIGNSAFNRCYNLTSVTIPNSVTSIGDSAFSNCSSLTSVTISESVTSIGDSAFSNCSSLTSVTISESVTSIGDSAFYFCHGLTSVNISDLSAWCQISFSGEHSNPLFSANNLYLNSELITDLTIPNDITEINDYAFVGLSVTSVTIPESVTSIGNSAFYSSHIKELVIEDGEKSLNLGYNYYGSSNDGLFYNCSLETVYLGRNLSYGTYVNQGYSPFYSTSITTLTIGGNVTTISKYAFKNCSKLTSVTIPSSVTSINSQAFLNCTGLKSVYISDLSAWCQISFSGEDSNPLSYAHNLYLNGELLTNLTIPDGITGINTYAFYGCSRLTSVTIPSSVTSIGDYAFSYCSLVKAIWLPNTPPYGYYELYDRADINYVGNDSYYSEDSNRQIYPLINSLKEINGIIYVPVEQTESMYDIIGYVGNETSINIGEGLNVANIAPYAFYDCNSLASVTIPDKVLSVGNSAFANSGIKELTIDDGEETINIEDDAFDSCPIATLHLGRNLSSFAFTRNMQDLKNLTISDNVTSLGSYAFSGCESLETVMIPNSVTSIGQSAFNSCENLKSVTISAGVLSIGSDAFGNTDLTKTVWLPNTPPDGYEDIKSKCNYVANESYTELSNQTVYPYLSSMFEMGGLKYVPVSPSERTCDAIDCSYDNTADIIIAKTVNYRGIEMTLLDVKDYLCYNNDSIKTLSVNEYGGRIGRRSFQDCTRLETVGIHNMADSIGDEAFYNCINLKAVDISGVGGNIGESAFYNCTSIETVSLSDIMGGIGSKAFYNCKNLDGIEIPNTVTGIGSGCFQNCSSLAYAIIGSGIKDLPEDCFRECSSLPEIAIPATVESIGNNVFYDCSSLARVDIEDRQSVLSLGYNSDYSSSDQKPLFSDCPLDSVYIGGNISYATDSDRGYSPFYRNTSLRAVKITDQETEISENEFYGCTGLTTVELGDGIESIGNYAFSGCSALDSFSFGHSVTAIGEEAFSDCTAMTRLQSRAEVPPVCGNQALDDINKWTCELFVPTKSLDAYKAAEQWKEFFFITGEDYDKPGSVEDAVSENGGVSVATYRDCIEIIGADNAVITVYNTNGQLVYSGTETTIGGLARGVYIVQVGGKAFKVAL